ncbi:nucleocapsid protein [Escherichia coli]|nr:nucleocapsid protein [Escherichia coli]MCI7754645.1 nucleocapsid protein [Shigella flexneri]EAA2293534.1 nucleocapsid protein [Escherichia coli]EFB3656928.1 nucleocapsid protein [Escherichia coli]EFD7795812.1 nucleocapsid protein [Escherichia coli]EFK3192804.1 nucleocapsid protein [Escherichia coli]
MFPTLYGVIIGVMPQPRRMQDVLRLAGELSIVRVVNDFQPLPILLCFQ